MDVAETPDTRWPRDWEVSEQHYAYLQQPFPVVNDPATNSLGVVVFVPLDPDGKPDLDGLLARLRCDPTEVERLRAQAAAFRSLLEAWRDEFYFENFEGKYRECKVCGADDTRDHDEGCIVQRTLTTLASDAGRAMLERSRKVERLRAENAAQRRVAEALNWLLHLHHGVSKGGGEPSDAEWLEALREAEAALAERGGVSAQRIVYLRCTGFLDSLPEAPNCCESCLEDDGTGDASFEEYRPPALPGRWPLDSWVVFEVCCTHLWWLKSLDEQEQRRVVARWLHWHRRQRGGEG